MYYTYVLISLNGAKTYTGITSNIEERLAAHNNGSVTSSKSFRPYRLLFVEKFITREEARNKEVFFKSRTGRRRLKEMMSSKGPSKC